MKTIIDQIININGVNHHIIVNMPHGGAGGSYHVMIDNFYAGAIVKYLGKGWTWMVDTPKAAFLTSDDIEAILDIVRGEE